MKADKKARLRALKDLDQATATLIDACSVLLDATLPEQEVRAKVFIKVPRAVLEGALKEAKALIRPPDDVFYLALTERYTAVRRYLPAVLRQIRFEAGPAGQPVTAAYDWLRENGHRLKPPTICRVRSLEKHGNAMSCGMTILLTSRPTLSACWTD